MCAVEEKLKLNDGVYSMDPIGYGRTRAYTMGIIIDFGRFL